MKNLKKGIISREAALAISPEYVAFVEGDFGQFFFIEEKFSKLKRGQPVLTYNRESKQFLMAKVSSVNYKSFQAVDGPVVRVSNGEFSWRVDGSGYAYPLPGLKPGN